METVVVQLTNQNALGLLQKLEEMHIIKLLRNNLQTQQDLSEKFAGKLPPDVADDLQRHITQSRGEWWFSNYLNLQY
ncbi:MAG: hypothetical protein HY960_03270 [Ignavibacteriae bacterium]|nr:hypothetical protein [Ignavibacteriota bacterium]